MCTPQDAFFCAMCAVTQISLPLLPLGKERRGIPTKSNTLTSLLVQFYLLLGFSCLSAACGLKEELKHLKKPNKL